MEIQHLAIASVPVQAWNGNLYEYNHALCIGTIFPELNMPFFAAESLSESEVPSASNGSAFGGSGAYGQQDRETLMARISAVSFALDDLMLFLDTHSTQQEAVALRKQLIEERKRLLKEYDEKYYSLTKDCEGPWTEGPMPWEGACI